MLLLAYPFPLPVSRETLVCVAFGKGTPLEFAHLLILALETKVVRIEGVENGPIDGETRGRRYGW